MTSAFRVLADFAAAPYDPSYGGGIDVLGGGSSGSHHSSTGGSHSSSSHGSSSHGSSHGSSEHHALFGSFTYLKADKWSYSLLIVVGSILLIEAFFHIVHISTRDSPFHKVISAIEKELMIVGITAFMFKIVLNSIENLDSNWFFALEIADLIVPLFSFTNCFLSFLLIFRSVVICDIWSKAYHLKAAELLDEYLSNWFYLEVRRWFPIASKLIAEIEFQMMHDIFCEHYSVQRKAFAFDEYASLIYERFVHEIIELRTEHWAVFIALLMFIWLPHKTMTGLAGCHDNPGAHHCSHEGSMLLLIVFGCGLLLISAIFVIVSRYYQVAIIHKSGVTCIDDYPTFLQSADEGIENVVERKRLGESELKAVIKAALHEAEQKKRHEHHSLRHVRFLIVGAFEFVHEYFASKHRRSVAPSDSVFSEDELKKMINSSFQEAVANQSIRKSPKKNATTASEPQSTTAEPCALTDGPDAKGGSPAVSPEHSPIKGLKHKPRVTSLKHSSAGKLTDIFWLGRPILYFEGVQLLLLPISLYFAVWFLEFDVYEVSPMLKFISFMVGVASVFCFMYVVKSAALLKAIYHVDKDAMLEVIEQTEGSRQLGETIRGKLLENLANIDGDAYTTLRNLFDEIDKNHSNKLSRVEFEVLMDRLDVNFSRKKWKQIYHEIDRNYDDEISFDEFFMFLFPQHDFATANELKRMKLVRHRVAQRSQKIRKTLPSKRNLNDDGLDEDDFLGLVDDDLEAPPVIAEVAMNPPSSSQYEVAASEKKDVTVVGEEKNNNASSSVENGEEV